MKRLTWKIGGEAGFGIMVSGLTFSRALSRAGYNIVEVNEYPSLIRGGHNTVAVTFSDEKLEAPYQPVDLLIALNNATIQYHQSELSDNALVIYDGEAYKLDPAKISHPDKFLSVPILSLAKQVGGDMLMRNTVALGASLALLGIDLKILTELLTRQFTRKGDEVVKQNVEAAREGYDYIVQNYSSRRILLSPKLNPEKKLVLTGAEAVGLGAIASGMKFFTAYPMTPINGLLSYMAAIQEKAGIIYKQPEDEIAGINMAIGASFAGVRAMTATSGGGFSLMVEGVSLAGMIEQPIVIVMGMRPGPATGLPTWTGQADLHFILNASQGEFPRLVLAPGDAQEAFYMTGVAFNLADIYQTPTFLLVDKYLFESRFNCPVFDYNKIIIDRGKLLTEKEQNNLKDLSRYKLTDDGISPRGIPGRPGGLFRANSDEHNEAGFSEESAENTKNMIDKRMKKQTRADETVPDPIVFGDSNAEVTLVGWGSTKGAALEALKQLRTQNPELRTNYLHLNYINPFPSKKVTEILNGSKKVIDIEGNHNGQMAQYIRMKTGFDIKDKILKYDGRPFYPEDIVEGIKKII